MATLLTNRMVELFVQEGRRPGKHVSTAIHRVMASLHPDRFGGGDGGFEEESDRLVQTRFNLGNAMEEAIVSAYAREFPGQYVRPGQLEYDGILGTPDLWDVINNAVVEVKLTWASSSRAEDIEDAWFWRYWAQLKSYCKMSGFNKGHLIIVFINGNYRRGEAGAPTAMMWEEVWEDSDLDENWAMIKANADVEIPG